MAKIQSSEDRDLASQRRRRDLDESGKVESTLELAEVTRPTELIDSELEQSPALREIWDRVTRLKAEHRHALRSLGSKTLELYQNADPDLPKRVDNVEKRIDEISTSLRIGRWILGFVIASVLGGLGVVATKIFAWGYGSGDIERRLQYIEKNIEMLNQRPWRTTPQDKVSQ